MVSQCNYLFEGSIFKLLRYLPGARRVDPPLPGHKPARLDRVSRLARRDRRHAHAGTAASSRAQNPLLRRAHQDEGAMAWLVRVPSWHGWCAYRHGMAGARTVMACAATGARDPCLPSAAPQRSPCSGFRLSCRSSRSPRCEGRSRSSANTMTIMSNRPVTSETDSTSAVSSSSL